MNPRFYPWQDGKRLLLPEGNSPDQSKGMRRIVHGIGCANQKSGYSYNPLNETGLVRHSQNTGPESNVKGNFSDMLLLKLTDVTKATGMGRSTIYRKIGEGNFPAPLALSPGCVRWDSDDLETWKAALPRAGNDNAVAAGRAA